MLVITRRAGERIVLGDDIVIEVMEVSGKTVRIGIDAPRSVKAYREEVWAAVREENRAAAEADVTLPSTSELPGRPPRG